MDRVGLCRQMSFALKQELVLTGVTDTRSEAEVAFEVKVSRRERMCSYTTRCALICIRGAQAAARPVCPTHRLGLIKFDA